MIKIWDFIKDSKNQKYVLLGALVLIIVLYLFQMDKINRLDTKNIILRQNQEYYKDSINIERNKVGELQFERAVLVTTRRILKKDSSMLADELKKQNGKVIFLSNTIAKIKNKPTDTITTIVIKYPDNLFGLKWEFDDNLDSLNYRLLAGETKFILTDSGQVEPKLTQITRDELGLSLQTGLVEDDGILTIFIKSNKHGFSVTQLEGAIIDPKKSKVLRAMMPKHQWVIGPTFSTGIMYNPSTSNLGPYVGIGIGLTRRISSQDIKNFFKR